MRRILLLSLLLLPLGLACKDARVASGSDDKFIHGPEELNATPPPPEKPLYPSTVGNTWVYRLMSGDSGTEEVTVLGTRVVEGTTAIVYTSKQANQPLREEMYRITPQSIEQLSAGGKEKVTLKPAMPLIQFPLSFDTGSKWQGGVLMRGVLVPSQSHSRLRAVEKVTVPAGTFTAYRIDTELDAQLQEGIARFWTTRWFVPGIGPVRIRYTVQSPGQPEHTYLKELLRYKV
jgi:hypothetical protein